MSANEQYEPPEVWTWRGEDGPYAAINRPTAGATHEQGLPVGRHPFQLYSLGTPNGQKVTIMLEELLQAGHSGAEYDAWLVRIMDGDQFGSGFVAANPNSKVPVLIDQSDDDRITIFESGAILHYLAEKFDAFMPIEPAKRARCLSWLYWQAASTPYVAGGGFGHFYAQAPCKIEYAIERYTLETKRQLDLLDQVLAGSAYLAGNAYSIADIAIWPWYGTIVRGDYFNSGQFLQVESYRNLRRWERGISKRPAVQRGIRVNRLWGPEEDRVIERHDRSDFGSGDAIVD